MPELEKSKMRTLYDSGFRAWSKVEVMEKLEAIELAISSVLSLYPISRESTAFQTGHDLTMRVLYVAFGLSDPKIDY